MNSGFRFDQVSQRMLDGVDKMGQRMLDGADKAGQRVLDGADKVGQRVLGGADKVGQRVLGGADKVGQRVLGGADKVGQLVLDGIDGVGRRLLDGYAIFMAATGALSCFVSVFLGFIVVRAVAPAEVDRATVGTIALWTLWTSLVRMVAAFWLLRSQMRFQRAGLLRIAPSQWMRWTWPWAPAVANTLATALSTATVMAFARVAVDRAAILTAVATATTAAGLWAVQRFPSFVNASIARLWRGRTPKSLRRR